jgi:hypothetical protein
VLDRVADQVAQCLREPVGVGAQIELELPGFAPAGADAPAPGESADQPLAGTR